MKIVKKTFMATTLTLIVFVISSNAADVAKIGVINLQRVLETSSAGKAAFAEIKKQKDNMENELQKRRDEIQQLSKQLEREAMVMSKELREDKEREVRIKTNDFKTLQKKYIAELQQYEKKFLTRLRQDIEEIVQEIGKNDGYLLIVKQLSVLYAPTKIDITDQLIQKYNAKFAQQQGEAAKVLKK